MLHSFKTRKLGSFLAHGRQYRRMGLVYFVTSSQGFIGPRIKHKSDILQNRSIFSLLLSHSFSQSGLISDHCSSMTPLVGFGWIEDMSNAFQIQQKSFTQVVTHVIRPYSLIMWYLCKAAFSTLRNRIYESPEI